MLESKDNSKMKIAAGDGLVLGLILSALNYFEYLTEIYSGLTAIIIYVAGIVIFTKKYGKSTENFTYGKSLSFGILLSMFTYIILGLYTCLYASFINPAGYLEQFSSALEIMKQSGLNFNSENPLEPVKNPVLITFSYMLVGIFFGLLVSSITSIFTKKD